MSKLSHRGAYRLIHKEELTAVERQELQLHIQECTACREHAAAAALLSKHLTLEPVRLGPTPSFSSTYLRSAQWHSRRSQIMKPVYALGGIATLIILALAGWFIMRPNLESTAIGAAPSESLVAVIPESEPTETPEPTATPISPTEEPTATVETIPTNEPTTAPPTPEPTAAPDARAFFENIPAPSLSGTIFGIEEDPALIYLPPSYDYSDKRYPVVYFLPGGSALDDESAGNEEMFYYLMKPLIDSGQIDELILVVPAASNRYWPIFLGNSEIHGDWHQFLAYDLVEYIDAHYRTIPDPSARGLFGETGSGATALTLAMNHPDIFGVLYLNQPWLFAPGGLEESRFTSALAQMQIISLIRELETLSSEEAYDELVRRLEALDFTWDAGITLAYGWDFVGDPQLNAPYFEYLYVEEGVPASDEVWSRWEDGYGNLAQKVTMNQEALQQLTAIAISEASREVADSWSTDGLRHLSEELSAAGIPHEMHSYEANSYEFREPFAELIMPFFSSNLTSEE